MLYILIVKCFELYMDFALYKINILLLLYYRVDCVVGPLGHVISDFLSAKFGLQK